MTYALLLLIIFLPILFFIIRLKFINIPKNTMEYFLANKEVEQGEFIDTSVAYGYQVAAISLFATWGYLFGFWTIFVPLFWSLGYYLLKYLNDNGYLAKLIESKKNLTIHGFLAEKYKNIRIAQIAAIASMLGLSGTAFFEAEFTSSLITSAISESFFEKYYIVLFIIFVGIALVYIMLGGYRAIIKTDKLQLSIGFIAFTLFLALTYYKITTNGYIYAGGILYLITLGCYILLFILSNKLDILLPGTNKKVDSKLTLLTSLIIFIVVGFSIAYNIVTIKSLDSISIFFSDQQFDSIFVLGTLPLISLLLANGLWQVVDISNWQRLNSLNSTNIDYKKRLSKSIKFIGIYSPITWLLAIFFGMSLKYLNIDFNDAWNLLKELSFLEFNSTSLFENIYIMIFFLALISIMFSTLDSLILSISYTTYFDIILKGNVNAKDKLIEARLWTLLYTGIFFIIYIFIRSSIQGIDDILYTFYSFQLALFPSILFMLLNKNINSLAAFVSIIGGMIICLIPLVINSEYINPYSSAALFTIVGSSLLYMLFAFVKKFNVENE